MKVPEKVSRVTVELETGQWASFTREDFKAIDDCVLDSKFWPLLAFIAGLQELPDTTETQS